MEEKKLQKIRFTHDGPIYDLTPDWENIEFIAVQDIDLIWENANVETWTFTLEDGSTIDKDVIIS